MKTKIDADPLFGLVRQKDKSEGNRMMNSKIISILIGLALVGVVLGMATIMMTGTAEAANNGKSGSGDQGKLLITGQYNCAKYIFVETARSHANHNISGSLFTASGYFNGSASLEVPEEATDDTVICAHSAAAVQSLMDEIGCVVGVVNRSGVTDDPYFNHYSTSFSYSCLVKNPNETAAALVEQVNKNLPS